MGRKPNALITAHFTRGEKLADASNRYEYTCNACGQHFPKGRPEALTSHIARKCPSLSAADREAALAAISASSIAAEQKKRTDTAATHFFGGLEALAEVSHRAGGEEPARKKRRLDPALTHHLPENSTQPDAPITREQTVEEEAFLNEMLRRVSASNAADERRLATAHEHPPNIDPQLQGDVFAGYARHSPTVEPAIPSPSASPAAHSASGSRDALPPPQQTPASPQTPLVPNPPIPPASLPPQPAAAATYYPPTSAQLLPQHRMQSIFILNDGPNQPRRRTGFTTHRREQVGIVRKIGACVRCRMLKKPCSDGTPCSACQSVSDARTWRSGCIRAKLREEADSTWWGVGLWSAVSVRRLQDLERTKDPGKMTISLDGFDMRVDIKTVRLVQGNGASVWRLDLKEADLDNLATLVEWLGGRLLDKERSAFIKETYALVVEKAKSSDDAMLRQAATLWLANMLLLDPDAKWVFKSESLISVKSESADELGGLEKTFHTENNDDDMIVPQIQTALERLCARCAGNLSQALERRLVDRKTANGKRLETLLAALLLLGAGERFSASIEAWGFRDAQDYGRSKEPWPIDRDPSSVLAQGTGLADLLGTIMIARDVAPKIGETASGLLSVVGTRQDDASKAEASAMNDWLAKTQLKVEDIRSAVVGHREDGAPDWHMRLIGHVLERCMPAAVPAPSTAK